MWTTTSRRLEDELDSISRGEINWVPVLDRFWNDFNSRVKDKETLTRAEVADARELGVDPKSGRMVSVRLGRYGAAQIGTREEKPKFASLLPGQRITTITLDEALTPFNCHATSVRRLGSRFLQILAASVRM